MKYESNRETQRGRVGRERAEICPSLAFQDHQLIIHLSKMQDISYNIHLSKLCIALCSNCAKLLQSDQILLLKNKKHKESKSIVVYDLNDFSNTGSQRHWFYSEFG